MPLSSITSNIATLRINTFETLADYQYAYSNGLIDADELSLIEEDVQINHQGYSVASSPITITFDANQRGSKFIGVDGNTTININCNNTSENYIWVKNNGSSTATITIGDVSLNETEYDTDDIHVFTTANNISITSGQIMELKIIATTEAAFINVAFTYA